MADISAQMAPVDLKILMRSSPGLQVLAPEDFQRLAYSVEKLPDVKQTEIAKILTCEQAELKSIKAEYDQKRTELFQKYVGDVKIQEKKMIREFQGEMEKFQNQKETVTLGQLMEKMDTL